MVAVRLQGDVLAATGVNRGSGGVFGRLWTLIRDPTVSVGEILLERGKITADHLQAALAARKSPQDRIDRILVRMGFVEEGDVLKVLGAGYKTMPRGLDILNIFDDTFGK